MKTFLISICLSGLALGAFAQGQINLISNGASKPVFGVEKRSETCLDFDCLPRDKLGVGYTFEVWYAPGPGKSEGELRALVRGEFVKNGVFLKSGSVDIPGVFGGDAVTFQVRAWKDDVRITSWADFENDANNDLARGKSGLFSKAAGGKDAAGNFVLPLSLVGAMESFGLYTLPAVPEPSVIALGAIGFGAWVLRRRS